ncbi:6-phosphogluconate dehydrogenase, decarboxylating [Fulvivirga imtechensis AK7]|uniref:6-phosphogluconate dehydrogenase, decarboxylating n=2 Tax=Fulvivirga TaxID=396811 RepID=L8JXB1_9BACT|nr:6-phosphogluconate dehydrogenase, decarboxylating [Fulvivirga imtechensis AK7]
MGKSLAQNIAGKGIRLSVYNRHITGKEEGIAEDFVSLHTQYTGLQGFDDISQFIDSLETPRSILLMVNAGPAVDQVIATLLPLLSAGDMIIDGGNSHYKDTERREVALRENGIYFLGVGISGGEEGALHGPSLMPGGSKKAYDNVGRYLESIAARDKNGRPCCTYVGPQGAGHFVKMTHNGIEYAEMQLLAEVYHLLRYYLGKSPEDISNIFEEWKIHGLNSYILEITIDILRTKEGGELLLDKILDAAEQKSTGGWTVEAAFELGTPLGAVSEAVMARFLSAEKEQRLKAVNVYSNGKQAAQQTASPNFADKLKKGYEAARIINHATGFLLLKKASERYSWNLSLSEIARIWTNGCIIRSALMEILVEVLMKETDILQHPNMVAMMSDRVEDIKTVVAEGLGAGHALPVLSASLNHFLGYTTGLSPANLIQAQRDYFGAHTYQRVDRPLTEHFHTQWK